MNHDHIFPNLSQFIVRNQLNEAIEPMQLKQRYKISEEEEEEEEEGDSTPF
jgi:hypothetical protein